MGRLTKKASTAEEIKVNYDFEVLKARQINDNTASFDLKVNGVTIYGMIYREYTNSKGEEGTMITFPSRKGSDNKYYAHAFFPITLDLKNKIINDVIHILNEV